jgi:hypothetical protein
VFTHWEANSCVDEYASVPSERGLCRVLLLSPNVRAEGFVVVASYYMQGSPGALHGTMIIITGPGRAGTTFLAMLYRELGFDPGGRWNPLFNAGMEAREFRQLNSQLNETLGTVGEPRRGQIRFGASSAWPITCPLQCTLV